ncbi:DUF4279 domain-containing protein [Mariniblastus sp.]|jgi:hypothetical protein|nr:DUF4279 domain-containing protein [Mariniblastus sp.]
MAIYRSDMLNFRYEASLHVRHPSTSPDTISTELGRTPKKSHYQGDLRRTPAGTPLEGTYPMNYWECELETEDQVGITDFLKKLVMTFQPHRGFLKQLSSTGAEVCIHLGIFGDGCCASQFDNRLLNDLANTGFDLRLDFYGSEPIR